MLMEQYIDCVILALLGLCMGSFAGATVWRLRARQLVKDKIAGEKVDKKEYKQLQILTTTTLTTDRSRCLHCGHVLAWYDLLPLTSWISTGGKCRYCHEPIGRFEPLIELGVAVFFVGSFLFWPETLNSGLHISQFILWLIAGVLLAMLFAYDLKWFLLPNELIFTLLVVGFVISLLHIFSSGTIDSTFISLIIAAVILSGIYFLLWYISKGEWIGFGDVKLGLGLALLVGDWKLAFITLFAANLLGCLIVIPGLLIGKLNRKTHIPFGPLLIVGCCIAVLFGQPIIDWYTRSFI